MGKFTTSNMPTVSFLPKSIWNVPKRSKELQDYVGDQFYKVSRPKGRGYSTTGRGTLFSEFNPDLAKMIIEYWSNKGETILDPFCGRGTRVLIARLLKRKSIGIDVSENFLETVRKRISELPDEGYQPITHLKDSRDLHDIVEDNSVDFVLTCPPYWNLETYESGPGQLSDYESYEEFQRQILKVIKECHRVLKEGRYCCWVLNDFRREGQFIPLCSDFMSLFQQSDFYCHDDIVLKDRPYIPTLAPDAVARYCTVKIHSRLLVFRKGELIPRKPIQQKGALDFV